MVEIKQKELKVETDTKTKLLAARFTETEMEQIYLFIDTFNAEHFNFFKNQTDFFRTAVFSLMQNLSMEGFTEKALLSASLHENILAFNKAITTIQTSAKEILELSHIIKKSSEQVEIKALLEQLNQEPTIIKKWGKTHDTEE